MFSDKLRLFFVALYGVYVLMSLWLYGVPSDVSEAMALFVVPGLAATFLYFFYGGAFSRAKKSGSKRPPDLDQHR
jgi:hypothetical protein